jgi:hypothetical protein
MSKGNDAKLVMDMVFNKAGICHTILVSGKHIREPGKICFKLLP